MILAAKSAVEPVECLFWLNFISWLLFRSVLILCICLCVHSFVTYCMIHHFYYKLHVIFIELLSGRIQIKYLAWARLQIISSLDWISFFCLLCSTQRRLGPVWRGKKSQNKLRVLSVILIVHGYSLRGLPVGLLHAVYLFGISNQTEEINLSKEFFLQTVWLQDTNWVGSLHYCTPHCHGLGHRKLLNWPVNLFISGNRIDISAGVRRSSNHLLQATICHFPRRPLSLVFWLVA